MRAGLPAFANAAIVSSSEVGARYRSSVMVFRDLPFCLPAPYGRWPYIGPAVRQAYTGMNGWNSLRDQVDTAGSYARGWACAADCTEAVARRPQVRQRFTAPPYRCVPRRACITSGGKNHPDRCRYG